MNSTTINAARAAGFLTFLAGLYLIVAPWWVGFSANSNATTNSWIFGIVVAVLGLVGMGSAMVQNSAWLTVLAGAWLIIAPFVIGFGGGSDAGVNTWILGIIAVVLGGFTAISGSMATTHSHGHGTSPRMHA